jgi:hypothetical protein
MASRGSEVKRAPFLNLTAVMHLLSVLLREDALAPSKSGTGDL